MSGCPQRVWWCDLTVDRSASQELDLALLEDLFLAASVKIVRCEVPDNERLEDLDRSAAGLAMISVDRESVPDCCGWLRATRLHGGTLPILVALPPDQAPAVTELLEAGATDFLLTPIRSADLSAHLRRWLAPRSAEQEAAQTLKERLGLRQIIGKSARLLAELAKLARYARTEATVLIQGETGTGKEVCARALHHLSARSGRPFVAVNSGAIPIDLVENELFGHASGAYTGAKGAQRGVIEDAHGGTLFLDEIDSLPLGAQVKLLRFLQEKEFRPLGSNRLCRADVRVVVATNTEINAAIEAGRFRRDLYYRLNVLPLTLPPLRQRREDIALLAQHFLTRHGAASGAGVRQFTPAALQRLGEYDWPGNIRELENVVERALVLTDGPMIGAAEIDLPGRPAPGVPGGSFQDEKARCIDDFERRYLTERLVASQGNIARAAAAARKNRRAFFQLMRKHHLTVRWVSDEHGAAQVKVMLTPDK